MGKTGKWFKSFLSGKKDKKNSANVSIDQQYSAEHQNTTTTIVVVPKEKRRWSFRRPSVGSKDPSSVASTPAVTLVELEKNPEKEPVKSADIGVGVSDIEEASAIIIQSVFKSYLARKALKALRGLVKLQALIRGHLVRKQATATLRCIEALMTAQARARTQRIKSVEDVKMFNHRQSTHRRKSHERIKHSFHDMEENIKTVEMDRGEFGSNGKIYPISSQQDVDRTDGRISTYYPSQPTFSPAPSVMTDMSPRTCSGHFEDYSFVTAQNSPQCYSVMSRPSPSSTPFSFHTPSYPLYPNYMANTQSSKAKARSQSAPKQRPEYERQLSRGRRPSVEGKSNIPKGTRMQRCSSHISSTCQNYQYPWSIKLDKSNISLIESECGSNYSAFTNGNYCRSVVSYDPR